MIHGEMIHGEDVGLRDVPKSKGRECFRRVFQVLLSVEKVLCGCHHKELSCSEKSKPLTLSFLCQAT